MKDCSHQTKFRLGTYCFAAISSLTLFCLSASAVFVDKFNTKTGWTDTLNGGSVNSTPGIANNGNQFSIITATAANAMTSSQKTASNYTLLAGHTIELRVDINGFFSPVPPDTNTLAVLAFVPSSGGGVMTNGYSFAIGRTDFIIQKDTTVLYSVNPLTINPKWAATNCTMVMRMIEDSGTVTINCRVYKRVPNGAAGATARFTILYEQTVTDTPGITGTASYIGLAARNRVSPTGSTVNFDNLQIFDMTSLLLDDFSAGTQADLTNKWLVISKHPEAGDTVTESGGTVTAVATIDASGGYAGCFYQARSFQVIDGGRLELQADLVANSLDAATFPVLGLIPGGSAGAAALKEYFIAPSPPIIYNGKQNGTYTDASAARPGFGNGATMQILTGGRMFVTVSGETNEQSGGINIRYETRFEDTAQPVNSTNRIIWSHVFVDTRFADPGISENVNNQAPYTNQDAFFAITAFNAGAPSVTCTFDNARISFTPQPNAAPIIKNVAPSPSGTGDPKFLNASTAIVFDCTDEANVPKENIVITLNGVNYTNGSTGMVITPADVFSPNRHVVLSGVLSANVNYVGSITVSDALGAANVTSLSFDTFPTNAFVIEAEDYNFSVNADGAVPGGGFFDNPSLVCEGCTGGSSYNGQLGVAEVDFHSNHGPHTGYDTDHSFRYDDAVRTQRSADDRRAYIIAAGPGGEGGFNEQAVEGIHDGDWQNYTKTFPSGYYQVYMRQSLFKLPTSQVTLERVTTDPSVGGQSSVVIGTFIGRTTGSGFYRNVPLTDGGGNPLVLHLTGGVDTLRLSERVTGNDSDNTGQLELNYMAFLPTANPGTLRPVVTFVSPPDGFVVNNNSLPTRATILNRDTTVDTSSIVLKINGNPVAKTVTPTANGAEVSWSLSVLPVSPNITNELIWSDGVVTQSNKWANTYNWIAASNALPFNAMTNRGMDVRMVQIDVPTVNGNNLAVIEGMLAIPPTIVPDPDLSAPPEQRTWHTNVQTLDWNDNTGSPHPVPGLDNGISGWGGPPGETHDNIATEIFTYLQLKAGAHRFFIRSDDGMQLRTGANLQDLNATIFANSGGTFYVPVDFMVEADGLYPVRGVWHENGGYAEFHVSSVNPDTAAERIVNDPTGDQSDPNLVKAFSPTVVSLLSSTSPSGPFTEDTTGVVDPAAQTVTVPASGTRKFMRIASIGPVRVTSFTRSGSNVVIRYLLYWQPGF